MTIREIRARLHGISGGDTQFTARCPAHDDRQNSLSVGLSGDGKRILLNCFAGCSTECIVDALGLSMSDLFTTQGASKPQKIDEHTYEYRDMSGTLLYRKTRVDYSDGTKNFFFKQPNGTTGVKGVRRVPYNLPAVVAAQDVYFVEGEKCADAIIKTGRVATTLDGGANSKWLPEYAGYFKGKSVVIIPDNDAPGMEYARRISKQLPGSKIVSLPELADKEDVCEWLHSGHTMDELDALPGCDEALPKSEEKEPKQTQAEKLLSLIEVAGVTFFNDELSTPHAAIPVNGHCEIWALSSSQFKTWLKHLYYSAARKAIQNESMGQVIGVLEGRALFEGEMKPLSVRVTERDGAFWYDLTDESWRAVCVTPAGWQIINNPPIMFSRYSHQAPQSEPVQDGDVTRILNHINLKDCKVLFLCWLVSCFIPDIPHPIPNLYGEKGAAKSTSSQFMKLLIDPSTLETLTFPNDARCLAVNLQKNWFLPFDNVSYISEETSDTLCRAVTGGGIQQRKLFTNDEDAIFRFMRCISINGINCTATRPDLLDRSLLLELNRISETDRRELTEVREAFEADKPIILGGIFDVLSKAMRIYPSVKLSKLPRMADFARWGYAIGEAMGGLGEQFLTEYAANREIQNTEIINADPVATLIVALMNDRDIWEGKVSELLNVLSDIAPQHGISPRAKSFPSQPNHLSRRLRGIKSNLESAGITCDNSGHGRQGTYISLSRVKSSSPSSHRHERSNTNAFSRDDNVTITDREILSSRLSSHLYPLRDKPCDDGDGCDDKIRTLKDRHMATPDNLVKLPLRGEL